MKAKRGRVTATVSSPLLGKPGSGDDTEPTISKAPNDVVTRQRQPSNPIMLLFIRLSTRPSSEAGDVSTVLKNFHLCESRPSELRPQTYAGGTSGGAGRALGFSSSFFSLASRGGRTLGLSFSSRFMRSFSHSSFLRSRSFSRSRSRSLCRRSLSR